MTANKDLKNKIKILLSSILAIDVNELQDDTTMNDIESWDSLKHLQIIIQLEIEFDLHINDQEAVTLVDLEKIFLLIQKNSK